MKNCIISVLQSEIEKSTGCTDPGSVTLAASRARRELGCKAEQIRVSVSHNVYKNGVSVGVPGTGKRGLAIAAAIGSLIDRYESGLAVMDFVTPDILQQAQEMTESGMIDVVACAAEDPLYVRVELLASGHTAMTEIMGDYSNIVRVVYDGTLIEEGRAKQEQEKTEQLLRYSVKELYDCVTQMEWEELSFLADCAKINLDAANIGMENPSMRFGARMMHTVDRAAQGERTAAGYAQALTAAAGEARMRGLIVPVMAIAGKGPQDDGAIQR